MRVVLVLTGGMLGVELFSLFFHQEAVLWFLSSVGFAGVHFPWSSEMIQNEGLG